MRNHLGEREFQTYQAWKRACKQINSNVKFDGDKDICSALGVGEWDGDKGSIYKDATTVKQNPRKVTMDDLNAAIKGLRMNSASADDLRKFISDFKGNDSFAARNIVAAAKHVLKSKQRVGLLRNPSTRSGNRSEVRSPTSSRTEVRSPTSTRTKTDALTRGNVTVTGGAGRGATTSVSIYPRKNPVPHNRFGYDLDAVVKRKGWKLLSMGPYNPGGGGMAPFRIVLSETGGVQPYVTHHVNLQDGGFNSGHYFKDYDDALADFTERCKVIKRNPRDRHNEGLGYKYVKAGAKAPPGYKVVRLANGRHVLSKREPLLFSSAMRRNPSAARLIYVVFVNHGKGGWLMHGSYYGKAKAIAEAQRFHDRHKRPAKVVPVKLQSK